MMYVKHIALLLEIYISHCNMNKGIYMYMYIYLIYEYLAVSGHLLFVC